MCRISYYLVVWKFFLKYFDIQSMSEHCGGWFCCIQMGGNRRGTFLFPAKCQIDFKVSVYLQCWYRDLIFKFLLIFLLLFRDWLSHARTQNFLTKPFRILTKKKSHLKISTRRSCPKIFIGAPLIVWIWLCDQIQKLDEIYKISPSVFSGIEIYFEKCSNK